MNNLSAKDKALKQRCEVFYAGLQRKINRNFLEGSASDEMFNFIKTEVERATKKVLEPV